MAIADSNRIIRSYLITCGTLTTLLATVNSIYCPRLPENATLPAVGFFTRGGTSTPYIPDLPSPSVQFDCWADNSIDAREVYRALYDALQGIQNVDVVIGVNTYVILSAREEVQGQDLIDDSIPGRFRVLTFFEIQVK